MSIRMYFGDHPPPHFHACYESSVALIEIETGEELKIAWAIAERADGTPLGRIPGLDK